MQPDEPLRIETLALLDQIRIDIEAIPNKQGNSQAAETFQNIHTLTVALTKLRAEMNQLMVIRSQPNQLYPAIPIISNELVPAHTEFYNAATLAMNDADILNDVPAQQQVYRAFAATRHTWSMMILSFRSYMSFRSGLFPGDWQDGTRMQMQHVDEYNASVTRLLNSLIKMDKQGLLELKQSDELNIMRAQQKKVAHRLQQDLVNS